MNKIFGRFTVMIQSWGAFIGATLTLLSVSASATPITTSLYDHLTHDPVGAVQWEVFGETAVIDVTLDIQGASIESFAFNTNEPDFIGTCGGCLVPPAPNTGTQIDDSLLTVSVRGMPSAIVQLDGTDGYDWDMYDFAVQALTVDITGLPITSGNEDIAIYNRVIASVLGFGGEFGVALRYTDTQNSNWAYTNIAGFDPGCPPNDNPDGCTGGSISAPAPLALFSLGLAGLGWSRRKLA